MKPIRRATGRVRAQANRQLGPCWICGGTLNQDGACPRALEIGRDNHRREHGK